MALEVFIPAAIILPSSGGTITQFEDIPFSPNFSDALVYAAGSTFPGFSGSHESRVSYSISTSQIKTILDYCQTDDICQGHTSANLDIEYQQLADLATRTANAGTVHQRHRFGRGLVCWESIEASEGGFATVSVMITPTSTDDSNPVTITDDLAMTSSAAVATSYGLGPVKVDGTLYCVDRWSLNLNPTYELRVCSGGPYLRLAAVRRVNPVLTATLANQAEALANWSTGGAAISTSVTAFLRKRDAGKISVAPATAEHIAVTGTAGSVKPIGRNEVQITLHNITTDTASAIS